MADVLFVVLCLSLRHFEVLDGGNLEDSKVTSFARLGRQVTTRREADVDTSSRAIFAWLSEPTCPFRAYLQIMSGAGVVYGAQVEEKVMRSFAICSGATLHDFILAAKRRLCDDLTVTVSQSYDDAALTQGTCSGQAAD